MTGLAQAIPATPVPLLVAAAAVPEVAVPCPMASDVLVVPVRKFHPVTSLDARSGWSGWAPESITPIVMLETPVVISQAFGAWIFGRCHCEVKYGSLGVVVLARATKSFSTNVNCPERSRAAATRSAAC